MVSRYMEMSRDMLRAKAFRTEGKYGTYRYKSIKDLELHY